MADKETNDWIKWAAETDLSAITPKKFKETFGDSLDKKEFKALVKGALDYGKTGYIRDDEGKPIDGFGAFLFKAATSPKGISGAIDGKSTEDLAGMEINGLLTMYNSGLDRGDKATQAIIDAVIKDDAEITAEQYEKLFGDFLDFRTSIFDSEHEGVAVLLDPKVSSSYQTMTKSVKETLNNTIDYEGMKKGVKDIIDELDGMQKKAFDGFDLLLKEIEKKFGSNESEKEQDRVAEALKNSGVKEEGESLSPSQVQDYLAAIESANKTTAV